MRSLTWCLAGLVASSLAVAAARASTLEERVDLEARGVSLRAALKQLTRGTQTKVRIDPQVPDPEVRLTLKGVTVDHALRLIVRQVSRQAPAVTYEAAPEGFRVYLGAIAPDEATQDDPNKFTVTRAVPQLMPEPTVEPAADPADKKDPDPNEGAQDPPRIDPTPAQYRLMFDPGTPSYSFYRPPGSPVYNDKMPLGGAGKLMQSWGASAYTFLGPPVKITDWRWGSSAPLRIEPIMDYYHPLSPGRRRPPAKDNAGSGGGGTNPGGTGGGPGGFGRRPL